MEFDVGETGVVGVAQVELSLGGAVDTRRVVSVSVPVSTHGDVPRVPKEELQIGDAGIVAVTQIHEAARRAIQTRGVDAVTIPIAHEPLVAGDAVNESL